MGVGEGEVAVALLVVLSSALVSEATIMVDSGLVISHVGSCTRRVMARLWLVGYLRGAAREKGKKSGHDTFSL